MLKQINEDCKVSFILYASFDTCYRRARTSPEYIDYSEEQIRSVTMESNFFVCLMSLTNTPRLEKSE